MLKLTIKKVDFYDEEHEVFVMHDEVILKLEHSLVSLSKWESIFERPFLGAGEKSKADVVSYIEAMILTPDFSPEVISRFSQDNFNAVNEYINRSQSATWFSEKPGVKRSTEVITSELIYYWMFAQRIPIECETWNLNRLFTLLRIFDTKNSKPEKMNRATMLERRRMLNEQRKAQLGTSG